MKLKQVISNLKTIDKKTCGCFSFSLAISLLVCILTTYIAAMQDTSDSTVCSIVDTMKPYIVSLFATVITFLITTLSQSFIQVISLRAKNQDVTYTWLIVSLGYSLVYTLLYFVYLIKCDVFNTIMISIFTIIAIILPILSFAEAFSMEKPSLVGDK